MSVLSVGCGQLNVGSKSQNRTERCAPKVRNSFYKFLRWFWFSPFFRTCGVAPGLWSQTWIYIQSLIRCVMLGKLLSLPESVLSRVVMRVWKCTRGVYQNIHTKRELRAVFILSCIHVTNILHHYYVLGCYTCSLVRQNNWDLARAFEGFIF